MPHGAVLLAGAALALWAPAAHAQMTAFGGAGAMRPVVGAARGAPPPEAPPPGLPGARTASGEAAPSDKLPTDMSPNEAMFDAINRGDTDAVRDALKRGAVLNAHNILGMTPLELAVDLGRNDITFLLMSMRGADMPAPPTAQAAVQGKPGHGAAAILAETGRRGSTHAVTATVSAVRPAPSAMADATPRSAPLFAGNGGTPNPGAGFLGFDTGTQVR